MTMIIKKRLNKPSLHPRNRHQGHYDLKALIKSCPGLASFVVVTPLKELSIDFGNPVAVKMLNRALLMHFYGLKNWEIPSDYLCPPVPGRSDHVHYLAELLGGSNRGQIPKGNSVRALDIGVGSNCIYPIIGYYEYGWHFVGTDIDPVALASARKIVSSNPGLAEAVELRLQTSPPNIYSGLLQSDEIFDISICNPPFHASAQEAAESSVRKSKNLGIRAVLNFGGKASELWCPGGEVAFIRRMIQESRQLQYRIFWFTTLVSKESNLPMVYGALKQAKAYDVKTIDMAQGQKKSRIVAWTFFNERQQDEWRLRRWIG